MGREPEGFGHLADALLRAADPRGRRFSASLIQAWERIAGPEVAKHSVGGAMREGELLVYVDTPAWANELTLMSEQYRQRLNEELGKELVKSLRFTVSRRTSEARERDAEEAGTAEAYRVKRVEPVPLTATELAQVEFAAAPVKDEGLRKAATSAMIRHLEWQKGRRAAKRREAAAEGPQKGDSEAFPDQ